MTTALTAVYFRQSVDDPDGIDRQRAIVTDLCSTRGWTDVAEYVDDGESATPERRHRPRPAFTRLWADVEVGRVGRIVVSVPDRLYRDMRELENIIDHTSAHRVPIVAANGEMDLATDTGRLVARILAATARGEIERKKVRQRDALKQAAEKGRPHWAKRPYGFTVPHPPAEKWSAKGQPIILEPTEAALIRQAYVDVLAGNSLHGIAADWNARGIKPPQGTRWRGAQVRQLLLACRNAGLRTYRAEGIDKDGQRVSRDEVEGSWPAIVPVDVYEGVTAILNDPKRIPGRTRARVHLLSGLATCWKCRQPVKSARTSGRTVYTCREPGCMAVARAAAGLERVIVGLVVARLAKSDAVELLVNIDTADVDELRQRATALKAKITETRQLYEDGVLTAAELKTTRANLTAKLNVIKDQLHDTTRVEIFDGLPLGTPEVGEAFDGLSLDRQRTVIAALLNITIKPAGHTGPRFRPETVDTTWKI